MRDNEVGVEFHVALVFMARGGKLTGFSMIINGSCYSTIKM